MYLFIFFWSSALQTARKSTGADSELPFGLIFSNFMCSMLTGSTIFGLLNSRQGSVPGLMAILTKLFVLTSFCLGLAANLYQEHFIFIAFCVIEGCIGAYLPAMASLKNHLINDESRGRTYSLLRAPLNIFVIVAHCLDEEGNVANESILPQKAQ